MIYGYYCLHPERVHEYYKIQNRNDRIKRLTDLNAPSIIMTNERKVLESFISQQSNITCYNNRIKKLYSDNKERDIMNNYREIFDSMGFDPLLAYSTNNHNYNTESKDYLKPLLELPDSAAFSFIEYTKNKFDAYINKITAKINEMRDAFIERIKLLVERGYYPKYILERIPLIKQTTIEIDDGFETSLNGIAGWHNAYHNMVVISAAAFKNQNALILFHELFHALAGNTDHIKGLKRLESFFDMEESVVEETVDEENEVDTFEFIDEAYVNSQAINMYSNNPPQWLTDEYLRDKKIELMITRTGLIDISKETYMNAYFSNNPADVEILFKEIKESHVDIESLFFDLQLIKDKRCTSTLSEGMSYCFPEDKYNTIDSYYQYCRNEKNRMVDKLLEVIFSNK